jgi:hypothetical protein
MKILEQAFSFTYFEPFLAKIGFSVKSFQSALRRGKIVLKKGLAK